MAGDRARRQGVEQVVVGPVVTEPEDEVRRLLAVGKEAAHVDALVDAERTHLDDLVSCQHLRRCAREVLVEVVEELSSPPGAVLR